jgi:hypothetical protein
MTTGEQRVSKEWSVKGEVTTLLVAGFLLVLVGGLIAYAAWPAQEISSGAFGDVEDSGSAVWAAIGCIVLAAGQVMAAIGVIAVGVRFGTRD